MRTLIISLLFLPTLALASPASEVFMHECKQLNQRHVGFQCQGIDAAGELQLHVINPGKDKAEQESFKYEYSKLILRFIELGGTYIEVSVASWPEGTVRSCQATSNRTSYTCYDCKWVEKDGGKICEDIN